MNADLKFFEFLHEILLFNKSWTILQNQNLNVVVLELGPIWNTISELNLNYNHMRIVFLASKN
jgi:hypothetical protein